jgi:acetyl/propionyl-CoA carboxylase alpha subunit
VLIAAALWEAHSAAGEGLARSDGASIRRPYNPWRTQAASLGLSAERRFRYTTQGHQRTVTLAPLSGVEGYTVAVDGAPWPHEGVAVSALAREGGLVTLAADGCRESGYVARRGGEVLVSWCGRAYRLAKPHALDVAEAAAAGDGVPGSERRTLSAPMAGTVIKVNITEGEAVAERQTLVVLGAMKMEHAIAAPYAGRVVRVTHQAGDVVPGGEPLVEIEAGTEDAGTELEQESEP